VQQQASERASRQLRERDEAARQLRDRCDELVASEAAVRRAAARAERERDDVARRLAVTDERLAHLEITTQREAVELRARAEEAERARDALRADATAAREELERTERALGDAQGELRIAERRAAAIIKDLQKQLLKERKEKGDFRDSVTGDENNQFRRLRQGSTRLRASSSFVGDADSIGVPKVEKLTEELVQLAQENELLNKKAKHSEEEIKTLHEKITRISDELEHKSKTVQQYILRDYASQIQPEEKPKGGGGGFNLGLLANSTAMGKMDPVLLAQVNVKMQKLLEELTSKLMGLEDENRVLKSRAE
ncbi:hypothetical protein HK405_015983, partial [Cladochytrium tenue]